MNPNERVYLQPCAWVMSAINDIIELQNGKIVCSDFTEGRLAFCTKMYKKTQTNYFTVIGLEGGGSRVLLEIVGCSDSQRKVSAMFGLLESIMHR